MLVFDVHVMFGTAEHASAAGISDMVASPQAFTVVALHEKLHGRWWMVCFAGHGIGGSRAGTAVYVLGPDFTLSPSLLR